MKNRFPKIGSPTFWTRAVIFYLTAAFLWWACLLYTKNEEAFRAKIALYQTQHIDFQQDSAYHDIQKKYERQHFMIIGEGCAFIFALFFGLYKINRSNQKELQLIEQRRNFLLSITHELKSPIAGIQLVFETFLKRNLEKSQADRFAQNGLRDAERLQNLVNDLLLAARLEDVWQPHDEPLDLVAMLEETIARLKNRFPNAIFSIKKQSENSFFLLGDKMGMTAVFQNLLENAVKYSPDETPVVARLSFEKNALVFSVADEGIGIPAAEKPLVFDKFYRVGSEETRQTTGTGLGLYIVRAVVRAHGGQISVADNRPRGTIFTLVFPQKSA